MIVTGLFRLAHVVACPTSESSIIQVGLQRVIEFADGSLSCEFRGRNVTRFPAVIEGPPEGD